MNKIFKILDDHKFDVHFTDNDGWTALHYYARYGNYDLVTFFSKTGMDINLKTNDGMNCLHIAALYGHLNLCETLKDKHDFDVHVPDCFGRTALHFSARSGSEELFKYFADMASDIYLQTNDGKNCLHIATRKGHMDICKILITERNFDVHMADNDGWTALHYSAEKGDDELFTYFAKMGINIHHKTNDGKDCLHIAALYGQIDLCKKLVDAENFDVHIADNEGWTALHYSVRNGSHELFAYFANMVTDIHVKTKHGMNCLHLAALNGHLNLCKTLINEYRFDVNVADNDGWTALHYSAGNGSDELVTYFVDLVTDTGIKDNDGWNCLHIAALYGHLNLCKTFIVKHNFDIHVTDNDGCTALHFAARNGNYELVTFFVDKGILIDLKDNYGSNCLHIAALYGHLDLCMTLTNKNIFDVHMFDNDRWTALHFSARNGSYDLVKYFDDMETDIKIKTNDGNNCLHIAALHGHLDLCKSLIHKHDFNVHTANRGGWRALHFSASSGSYELVTYFVDMGTDIKLETSDRKNCLHIAALHGHLDLCKSLIHEHDFNVHAADHGGWRALHFSASAGSYELVRYFARMGTDIKLETSDGKNCLHIAALHGHLNLCKTLIHGHKFYVHGPDYDGWTALHFSAKAGCYELVTYFAGMATDIYLRTNDGKNCLHIAVCNNHARLCKTFLENHEFDVNLADNDNLSALHYSAKIGNLDLFACFTDIGTDIHFKASNENDCLHIAALYGHFKLCKTLVEKYNFDVHVTDNNGWRALHFAARSGSYKLCRYFAEMRSDINVKTNDGKSCLHIAAFYGHLSLCKELVDAQNIDVHMLDNEGWAVLHYSVRNGNQELVTYFADMVTDIHAKTKHGMNCLHLAALYGHFDLCKILLDKYNVDMDMADNEEWTALHFSARYGSYELVTFFADVGTGINHKTNIGMNCLHIAACYGHLKLCKTFIDENIFDVCMADSNGWAALHFAVKSGSYELVNYFYNVGADINLKTNEGMNCLHVAALYGHLNLCKTFRIKHKFDVHIADNDGWRVIHFSAKNGSYESIRYFVDIGANIYIITNDGKNCLHIAALSGHMNLCKTLIQEHNIDVNVADIDGWTALHLSAGFGCYELVRFFADMGTDVYLKTNDGKNCLHIAALSGHMNLCKTLIQKHNIDVNVTDNDGWAALHFSSGRGCHELVRFFADMGTDVYLKTNDGKNCLHIAALYGHLHLCKTLINNYSIDVHVTDNDGWTALHFSARYGSYKLVTYFADQRTDINLKTNDGKNCLHIAALYGHLTLCKKLKGKLNFNIHTSNSNGWTSLHFSAKNGSNRLVKYFVDMGTDVCLKTNDGKNCLHIAALYGHLNLCKIFIDQYSFDVSLADHEKCAALHYSAKNGSLNLFTYFIGIGTDINFKGSNERNCLHIAALYGHLNLCKTLIDRYSFDVNMTDNEGWTALHFSAKNGSYELVRYFAEMGIDINQSTSDKMNCLHIAALYGHLNLCKILKDKHYFDVDTAAKDGWRVIHFSVRSGCYELVRYFVDKGSNIYLKTNDGKNCLHIAALSGDVNLCRTLIQKHNFDVNMTDNDGCTALHFSARNGSNELFTYFSNMSININLENNDGRNCSQIAIIYGNENLFKRLIDKFDFNVNFTDNYGWTALHFCAKNGSYELFTFFVKMGTDINLKTKNGRNCLHIAALYGHFDFCKILTDKHKFDVLMADNDGWTALHFLAKTGSYEFLTYFFDIKTDIYLKTNDGKNCLHIAASNGHLNLCKTLIDKHNFDVHMVDNERWAALHFAAGSGSYNLSTYFTVAGPDINFKANNERNCLHIAALYGHLNLCKTYIDNNIFDVCMADDDGWTALHFSVINGGYELVNYFLAIGTYVNLKTNDGKNCLHISALYGHLDLSKTFIDKHNFNVHAADNDGWRAIHFSARSGCYELVQYFVNMEANIHQKTNDGKNCLHIAALSGHLSLCKTLIEKHNFDVNLTDNEGWTALHFSARNGSDELFTYFTNMGIDIGLENNDGWNCGRISVIYGNADLFRRFRDKFIFDMNFTNNDGWAALHFCAKNGSYELFTFFAQMGTDVNLKTNDGMTCLHIAALYGHLKFCKSLVDKHNTDVYMDDKNGWTALHFSAKNGCYELVAYFANMKTDILLKTNDGKNCLHIAASNRHLNLCKTLIDKHNFDVHTVDNGGWAALHFAAKSGSYNLSTYFINAGLDINFKANNERNWLHIAALYGHLNLCKTFIYKNLFDVNMADNDGWAALHFSVRNGSYELVNYFQGVGTDINLKTNDGKNCLHISALYGHLNLCKILIDKHNFNVHTADKDGWRAIHFSARSGCYKLLRYFIGMGSNIYVKTNDGSNCLHIAALSGHLDLCKTLIEKHKYDVNLADNDGWTALHFSARSGSDELLTYFGNMGIDINLKNNDGWNCGRIAAVYGNMKLFRRLVDNYKFNVNFTDNDGWTALHFSAKNGSYELFTFLAEMGTDVNLKTNDGMTCLHIAALYGHLKFCKSLVDKNNAEVYMADNNGWTPLHFSAKNGCYELVAYFANMKTDILLKTNDGKNCLHIAASNGHLHLCTTLINKHNFDVHMTDDDGWAALHYAARNGSYNLSAYFIDAGPDINFKASNGRNCLHIAALYGHLNLCKTYLDRNIFDVCMTDNDGWTALHLSVKNGDYELIDYFSGIEADVNRQTNDGMNCLHVAALCGHWNLCKILQDKHNFDVHTADNGGWRAIHFSARNGCNELVQYFVEMGADIHQKTNDGKNCLHIAALSGHLNLCKTLIGKHNFDVNVADNKGWTALHFSARNGSDELFTYFANMGIDIDHKNNDGWNCGCIAAMYGNMNLFQRVTDKYKFDVTFTDNDGWTALHFCAKNGSYELFTFFTAMGTDVNLKTNDGRTCLHIAALYGHLEFCKSLKNKHKFDIRMADNDGWTAIHFSAVSGSCELIKYFFNMEIDIHRKTNDGKNCLHIAAGNGHLKLCQLLIEKNDFDIHMVDTDRWAALHFAARSGSYNLFTYFADAGLDVNFKANNERNCLHIAALYGHLNLCKTYVDKYSFDVNMADNDGWTALHFSARNGSFKLVRYFADMENDINSKTYDGKNCLHIAALYGHLNLCKALINKYNFDVYYGDNEGSTPLHFSVRNGKYKLVRFFMEMGSDVYGRTNDGKNCLHIAALSGHLNLCKSFIDKYNFDVHMADYGGWTAFHCAARNGSDKLFTYFLNKGIDICLKNNDNWDCCRIAAIYGHLNICRTLIDKVDFDVVMADKEGWTALHFSARNGSYELVKFFVGMGLDIKLETTGGKNCLHIAAHYGHLNLCRLLVDKHKFDIHNADSNGWTALHFSASYGNYELVTFFIDMGMNIHLKANDGKNCLHIAALNGHWNLCNTLVDKYNFDVDIIDINGWTALHCSAKSGSYNLFTYFADRVTDIHHTASNGQNCLHIAARNGHLNLCKILIENYDFDLLLTDNEEWTALHCSAENGNFDLFSYILQKGNIENEVYCKTNGMENVLHLSAHNGHFDICEYVLEFFIKDYKDNNSRDQYTLNCRSYKSRIFYKYNIIFLHAMDISGNTYLHLAALGNQAKVCELLLKYDTEVADLSNKNDKTARDIAKENHYVNVLNVLKAQYNRIGMCVYFFQKALGIKEF